MIKLQKILDFYGESTGCLSWDGYCRECLQSPERVVGKINSILKTFDIDTMHNYHFKWEEQVKVVLDNLQTLVDSRYKREGFMSEYNTMHYNRYVHLINNFKF